MSFYFVLSLFPFFMIIAGFVGLLPSTTLWQNFAQWITDYLPTQSRRVVFETILDLSRGSAGFLSFGLIATLWSASSGFVGLMESLSRAYGSSDTRPILEEAPGCSGRHAVCGAVSDGQLWPAGSGSQDCAFISRLDGNLGRDADCLDRGPLGCHADAAVRRNKSRELFSAERA